MKKIALFGGTFDPIHYGHLRLAEHSYHLLHLDHIIFIPNYQNPFKTTIPISGIQHRINMLKLALKDYHNFSISDIEKGEKNHYTYDTVQTIKKIHTTSEIYFIGGSDLLEKLQEWGNFSLLIKEVIFIIAPRTPHNIIDIKKHPLILEFPSHFILLDIPFTHISSTQLRTSLHQNLYYDLIPQRVAEYITKHQLYKRN